MYINVWRALASYPWGESSTFLACGVIPPSGQLVDFGNVRVHVKLDCTYMYIAVHIVRATYNLYSLLSLSLLALCEMSNLPYKWWLELFVCFFQIGDGPQWSTVVGGVSRLIRIHHWVYRLSPIPLCKTQPPTHSQYLNRDTSLIRTLWTTVAPLSIHVIHHP